tara:strand:+ start:262 stop:393 length:132 start_codon:yes stop_codon:yes gene_type:complete
MPAPSPILALGLQMSEEIKSNYKCFKGFEGSNSNQSHPFFERA